MTGITLPRRALGKLAREARAASGKSQFAAGKRLGVSKQTIGRLEHAQPVRLAEIHLEALFRFYGAEDEIPRALRLLEQVREAKLADGDGGWYQAYADLYYSDFDYYLALEEVAKRMTTYQLTLLPGLLQTPLYRRATIQAAYLGKAPEREVSRRIELMTRRQARLLGNLAMDVIVSEVALRLPVGTPAIMKEQLRTLADAGKLPNVSIRIIPLSETGYPGLVMGSFTFFEFPPLPPNDHDEPPVVCIEGHAGAYFVEDEPLIARYRNAVDIHQRVALSTEDSRRLILEIAESLR